MKHRSITESSVPTRAICPFDSGGWTPIPNPVIDDVLPRLSHGAVMVLIVVIRQTYGWVAQPGGDPRQRRQWDRISYSQFQAKSGLGSRTTISRALSECMDIGILLRRQVGTERGQPVYVYRLNLEPKLEEEPGDPVSGPTAPWIEPGMAMGSESGSVTPAGPPNGPAARPENGPIATGYPRAGPFTGTENRPVATAELHSGSVPRPEDGPVATSYPQVRPLFGTENGPLTGARPQDGPVTSPGNGPGTGPQGGLTKQKRKQTEKNVAVGQPVDNLPEEEDDEDEQRSRSLELLMDAGVGAPQAWELSRICSLELVQEWTAYTRRQRGYLCNPPGFLINGLRSGKPPPRKRSPNAAYWERDREELRRCYAPYPQILTSLKEVQDQQASLNRRRAPPAGDDTRSVGARQPRDLPG